MKRIHRMPFGAELVGGGMTSFRLWAPSASRVELVLLAGKDPEYIAMEGTSGGWREAIVPAAAGMRYRFRIEGGLEVPDPASRRNPEDVHGPSEVVDPADFEWDDGAWSGRRSARGPGPEPAESLSRRRTYPLAPGESRQTSLY